VNGKTGYLADSESDMADMMVTVVEHPKVAEEMGKRGMERVRENYSWERFFKIFDKKLEEVKRK
jgi:glycosyltransferase involved in cell wall biosynthesis